MSYHDCKYNCGATDCPAPERILERQEISLQEEIAAYFSILEPAREKRAEEIVNKVLDAAIEAVSDTYYKTDFGRKDVIEAINKLRGE